MPVGMANIEPVQAPLGMASKQFPDPMEEQDTNNEQNNEPTSEQLQKDTTKLITKYHEDLDNVIYIKNILEKQPSPNVKVLFFLYEDISQINSDLTKLEQGVDSSDMLLNLKINIDSLFIQIQIILYLVFKKGQSDTQIEFEYGPKKPPYKPLRKDWLDYGSFQFYY